MSTTPGAPDLEARLRSALAARADLVRGEDLAPLATVTPLPPRWSSPWVLLAAAAVVLLVLGVVLQGVGGTGCRAHRSSSPELGVTGSCMAFSSATSARLAVDFTVPRLMSRVRAISASNRSDQ